MPTPRGRCHWPDQSGYLVSSKACAAPTLMPTAMPIVMARAITPIVLGSSMAPSLGDDRAAADLTRTGKPLVPTIPPVTARPDCVLADHDRLPSLASFFSSEAS